MRSNLLLTRSLGALLLPLAITGCGDGCSGGPYFADGAGPVVNNIEPEWENGNVGGALVLGILADRDAPTEDEVTNLIAPRLVRINGDFAACADATVDNELISKEVRVVFGNRNATVWSSGDSAVDVLTPVGPVRGGVVDVQVACRGVDEDGNLIDGVTFAGSAYDYYLGNVNADGERPEEADRKRMEPLFEDEFGSFTMFYQAEPFGSLPDATGYGYFFSESSSRSSMFWGQNPDMVYGGLDAGSVAEPLPLVPQVPELNYETPEQGRRLEAGDAISFFHRRDHNDPFDPVRIKARKKVDFATGAITPHTDATPNNDGVWLKFVVEGPGGGSQDRYLRVGQRMGNWCDTEGAAGCTGDEGEDAFLNRTRVHIDPSLSFMVPQRPTREQLEELYPTAVPEYLAFLDCNGDEACEDGVGVMLPSGVYEGVEVVKTVDEEGQWPWEEDEGFQGLRVTMERADVTVTEGAIYVDFPADVIAEWPFDEDQGRYDNFAVPVGEAAFPMGRPVYVSYPGAFSLGDRIPAKNYDENEDPPFSYPPDGTPEPGTDDYDRYPYIEIPEIEVETMLFATGGAFSTQGFPVQVPLDAAEDGFDWRLPLPGGAANEGIDMTGDGRWEDTYFVLSLTIRQIGGPGGFGGGPWKISAFAWPGDDFIVIPREALLTLPRVADAFRPDSETQVGEQYLGFASLQVHRLARWNLSTPEQLAEGRGFRSEDANVMFDVNAISLGYYHTENSCLDGIDNDGDGQIDASDTNCARADETYESGECQDGDDNDGDGLTDALDPDCQNSQGVYDPTDIDEGSACSDGIDNDGDGWIDYIDIDNDGIPDATSDPGCVDADSSSEGGFDSSADCNDGIDSDFDGLVDRDDPGCENGTDTDERGDTCDDGIDNNGDGWVDFEDLMCRPGRNSEFIAFQTGNRGEVDYAWTDAIVDTVTLTCSDFTIGTTDAADNDGDGLANSEDPDCAYGWDPSGEVTATPECSDGIDNDGDGWTDFPNPYAAYTAPDPDCITSNHPEGGAIVGGTCNDGIDNENDGWIDAQDPVCLSGADNETITAASAQYSILACNNNIDDDGDGDTDADDADCVSGKDNSEAN